MFGKKCTLCGGKLVDNKCVECGLDNTKTDKYYKLNQSSCDGEPLTHVHENPEGKKAKIQYHMPAKPGEKKQKKTGKVLPIVIVLIILLANVGPFLGKMASGFVNQFSDIETDISSFTGGGRDDGSPDYEKEGKYDYVERNLKTGTSSYDDTLSQGYYEVGSQIPEGSYSISLADGAGYFEVDDHDNGIYIWENFSAETTYEDAITQANDVRLYEGALLKIDGNVQLQVTSDSAAPSENQQMTANPLTETVLLKENAEAGVDFAPGVYDIKAISGNGGIDLFVPGYTGEGSGGDEYPTDNIGLAADNSYNGQTIKNVVIPKGTRLELRYVEVECTPSAVIAGEDYMKYYEQHYR
ncbi:MAG: hypothetical protein PHN80_12925 [Hespellia sp.]|nr:hypothetical protein [Hespellia sp.]